MAVFISVTTDAFEEEFSRRQNAGAPAVSALNIRRPVRGIEVKKDTYAVIKVVDFAGRELPLISSSAAGEDESGIGQSNHYANFIITGLREERTEKSQIVETFGEDFIFFFGERPRMINVQGVLINTNDFNWKSEFWENYEKNLRGTRLLEKNARMYMYFDDVVVEGYMLSASASMGAENPYHLPFQMQIFVTNYAFLSNVGATIFPRRTPQPAISGEEANPTTPYGTPGTGGAVANPDITKDELGGKTGTGGLNGFLASAAKFQTSASFSIHSTLETIKNNFYGSQLRVPDGIGNQLVVKPITNKGTFGVPPGGGPGDSSRVPIHTMLDEFVESEGIEAAFDQQELERVRKELKLRTPEELEKEARRQLKKLGVDTTRRDTNYLLLGRAAFAGLSTVGSFGMRQADGALDL